MCADKTKEKGKETGCRDSGFTPEHFQKMCEMMKKCCAGQGGFSDCQAMMEAMKKETCSQQETGKAETDCAT